MLTVDNLLFMILWQIFASNKGISDFTYMGPWYYDGAYNLPPVGPPNFPIIPNIPDYIETCRPWPVDGYDLYSNYPVIASTLDPTYGLWPNFVEPYESAPVENLNYYINPSVSDYAYGGLWPNFGGSYETSSIGSPNFYINPSVLDGEYAYVGPVYESPYNFLSTGYLTNPSVSDYTYEGLWRNGGSYELSSIGNPNYYTNPVVSEYANGEAELYEGSYNLPLLGCPNEPIIPDEPDHVYGGPGLYEGLYKLPPVGYTEYPILPELDINRIALKVYEDFVNKNPSTNDVVLTKPIVENNGKPSLFQMMVQYNQLLKKYNADVLRYYDTKNRIQFPELYKEADLQNYEIAQSIYNQLNINPIVPKEYDFVGNPVRNMASTKPTISQPILQDIEKPSLFQLMVQYNDLLKKHNADVVRYYDTKNRIRFPELYEEEKLQEFDVSQWIYKQLLIREKKLVESKLSQLNRGNLDYNSQLGVNVQYGGINFDANSLAANNVGNNYISGWLPASGRVTIGGHFDCQ